MIDLAHFFGPISVKIMDGVKLGNPGLINLHAFGAEGDARKYFIFHVKKQRQGGAGSDPRQLGGTRLRRFLGPAVHLWGIQI